MRKKQPNQSPQETSLVRSSAAEYLTFVASGGNSEASVEMRYEDENIWLTQKMMAELYAVSVPAINQHLKRIFADQELEEASVVKHYLTTAADGKSYQTKHYSLQAIIAVGFKIENERAVQFRKWANQIVKDYTIQGWTMDAERLKNGGNLTDEFFERQLEKIRGDPALRAQVLPEGHRHLRHRAGLRPVRHGHEAILCRRAKQDALRRPWPDSGGGDRGSRPPRKTKHGPHQLGSRSQRENPALRRRHRQELPRGLFSICKVWL